MATITSQRAADFGIASGVSGATGGIGRHGLASYGGGAGGGGAGGGAGASTPSTGNTGDGASCMTCNGAGSNTAATISMCDANTSYVECEDGDVCMIEQRRRNGELVEMKTGCKARHACLNLQRLNFYPNGEAAHIRPWMTQCRPEDPLTGRRFGASVCRQCFTTCTGNTGCFSTSTGIETASAGVTINFADPRVAHCHSPADCDIGRSFWDADLVTCAESTTLTAGHPKDQCSNQDFPPQYDGHTPIQHIN